MKKIFVIIIFTVVILFSIFAFSPSNKPFLIPLVTGDSRFINPYSILVISPNNFDGTLQEDISNNYNASMAFLHWLSSNQALSDIRNYTINGEHIFNTNNVSQTFLNQPPPNSWYSDYNSSNLFLNNTITLGTTTTVDASGILNVIESEFSKVSFIKLKIVIKSSGAIFNDVPSGNLNVILTHAPDLENNLVQNHYADYRLTLFTSTFFIVGPENDPAGIKGISNASVAFELIANSRSNFISRGDKSGTNIKELEIWANTNLGLIVNTSSWQEENPWYVVTGLGQSSSFQIAFERSAYMLIDQPTYLKISPAIQSSNKESLADSITKVLIENNREIFDIAILSLQVHISAIIFATAVSIPLGYLIARKKFFGRNTVIITINSFIGTPPVLVGLILWFLFSRIGLLGDLRLLYTSKIMILAQFLIALPIITGYVITSIGNLDPQIFEMLSQFNVTGLRLLYMTLREIKHLLFFGIVTAFGRIVGEVGAVLIVGGNIRFQTRILTTSIVQEINSGSPEIAIILGLILLLLAIIVNIIIYNIQQGNKFLPFNMKNRFYNYIIEKDQKKFLFPSISSQDNTFIEDIYKIYRNQSIDKSSSKLLLQIKDLKVTFNSKFNLFVSDLKISYLDYLGIIGPNGAGKTTLLRILSGVQKPDTGKIETDLTKEDIYFVTDKPIILDTTVYNNLLLAIHRNDSFEVKRLKMNLLFFLANILKIDQYFNQDAKSLSQGNKQKLSMIRTLLSFPKLLLLDEPFSNLDISATKNFEELLLALQSVMTIILTSHQLPRLKRIAKSIILLINGELIEEFSSNDLGKIKHNDKTMEYLQEEIFID